MEDIKELLEKIKTIAEKAETTAENGSKKEAGGHSPEKLVQCGIYKRFQHVTFDYIKGFGLPKDESIRYNFHIVEDFAHRLESYINAGTSLILAGGPGTLKTTMAVAILRQWIDRGHMGLFLPMVSLIDRLFTMREISREELARYEQRIKKTSLLILDDLGGENITQDWILSKVDSIITERYNRQLSTIITTNLTKNELNRGISLRGFTKIQVSRERFLSNYQPVSKVR